MSDSAKLRHGCSKEPPSSSHTPGGSNSDRDYHPQPNGVVASALDDALAKSLQAQTQAQSYTGDKTDEKPLPPKLKRISIQRGLKMLRAKAPPKLSFSHIITLGIILMVFLKTLIYVPQMHTMEFFHAHSPHESSAPLGTPTPKKNSPATFFNADPSAFKSSCTKCNVHANQTKNGEPPAPLLFNADCPCDSRALWAVGKHSTVGHVRAPLSPVDKSFCRPSHKQVAVMIHMGDWATLGVQFASDDRTAELRARSHAEQSKMFQAYLINVARAVGEGNFDVYMNLRSASAAQRLRREVMTLVGVEPIITLQPENRGYDMGGLFISIMASQVRCAAYDVVFKLHAKSNAKWLYQLVDPMMGAIPAVAKSVELLTDPERNVGIVLGSPTRMLANQSTVFNPRSGFAHARFWVGWRMRNSQLPCGDMLHMTFNIRHMEGILGSLGVPIRRSTWGFVAGTLFAFNQGHLTRYVNASNIPELYRQMNTPHTLDWNWYSVMHRLMDADPQKVQDHFQEFGGQKYKYPGSSLNVHHADFSFPDGEIEHAWERVLCILLLHQEYAAEDGADRRHAAYILRDPSKPSPFGPSVSKKLPRAAPPEDTGAGKGGGVGRSKGGQVDRPPPSSAPRRAGGRQGGRGGGGRSLLGEGSGPVHVYLVSEGMDAESKSKINMAAAAEPAECLLWAGAGECNINPGYFQKRGCPAACDCFGDSDFAKTRFEYLQHYRFALKEEQARRKCRVDARQLNATADYDALDDECLQVLGKKELPGYEKKRRGSGAAAAMFGLSDEASDWDWSILTASDSSASKAAAMVAAREVMLVQEEAKLKGAQATARAALEAAEKAKAAAEREREAAARLIASTNSTRSKLQRQVEDARRAAEGAQAELERARADAEAEKRAAAEMSAQMAEMMAAQITEHKEQVEEQRLAAVAAAEAAEAEKAAALQEAQAASELSARMADKFAEEMKRERARLKAAEEDVRREMESRLEEHKQQSEAELKQLEEQREQAERERAEAAELQARLELEKQQLQAQLQANQTALQEQAAALVRKKKEMDRWKLEMEDELRTKAAVKKNKILQEWEKKVDADLTGRMVASRRELYKEWDDRLDREQARQMRRKSQEEEDKERARKQREDAKKEREEREKTRKQREDAKKEREDKEKEEKERAEREKKRLERAKEQKEKDAKQAERQSKLLTRERTGLGSGVVVTAPLPGSRSGSARSTRT